MWEHLPKVERMRLLRFVCSFAWVDLEVTDREREFVTALARRLALTPDEERKVIGWLQHPPDPEEIDPTDIPREHRLLFVEMARGMVNANGVVGLREAEALDLLDRLTR